MDSVHRRQAEELFQQAADLPVEQRSPYLDERCGTDPSLREEVDALLGVFERPTVPSLQALDQMDEVGVTLVGEEVGPYKLLQLLGEGGFGVVYLAEQQQPVRRKVAVKIIKAGMDTRQVVARFDAERQALAMMEHPNIAMVFDAGSTETGRPYFAMELVRGASITEYCDKSHASTPQRLELFIQVCRAVQHAHQKGVIHRDIKPSNILVTLPDDVPVPKIIDFGIAKATHQPLTDGTLLTRAHQFIGTPQYVSPEQVEMSGLDVDTRTDVYSLGVLLYELLTGTPPVDSAVFRNAGYSEIQRIICEQVPVTPSRRLSTLDADLSEIAKIRQVGPHALSKLIRGDLDWIVMKALEKDRTRRYETAAALAADIERHLNMEPVTARPPSAAYQLRKLAARHKTAFGFAAVLFAVVAGFGVWMAFLYAEANLLRWHAEQERNVAQANFVLAQQAEERARVEAETAAQVAQVLGTLFEVANPGESAGGIINAREILDQGAQEVREKLADQPDTQAALLGVIGRVYSNLGLFDSAEALLRHALEIRRMRLGDTHPDTISAMNSLGRSLMHENRLAEAEPLLREALEIARSTLGDDHPVTVTSISQLSWTLQSGGRQEEAEPLCREALKAHRALFGNDHSETLNAINALAFIVQNLDRLDEAEMLRREALETSLRVFGADSGNAAESMNGYGVLLMNRRRLQEAEPLIRQALATRRRLYGDNHLETLESVSNLALLLWHQGELGEAEEHYRRALAGYRGIHGDRHRRTFRTMSHTGGVLSAQGRLLEAESMLDEALDGLRGTVGYPHGDTMVCLREWVIALWKQGRLAEAEPTLREALTDIRSTLGVEHVSTFRCMAWLGEALNSQGNFGEAEPLLKEALAGLQHELGDEHEHTGGCLDGYVHALVGQGKLDEAEAMLRESLAALREALGDEHRSVFRAMALLGWVLQGQEKLAEAEPLLGDALRGLRQELGDNDDGTLLRLGRWFDVLSRQGKLAEHEPVFREFLASLREARGDDDQATLRSMIFAARAAQAQGRLGEAEALLRENLATVRRMTPAPPRKCCLIGVPTSLLGDCLTMQGRYTEAESLLLEGYSISELEHGTEHKTTREAFHRIVKLYETWGKPEQAAEWRSKLTVENGK